MKALYILLLAMMLIGFGSGCTLNPNQNNNTNLTKVHTGDAMDQALSNQAKEKIINKDEVTDVKAVNTNKEMLMAIQIKHFSRFNIKKIEERINADLKKAYPDKKVDASTDQKIFLELRKLEDKLQKEKISKKKLEEEVKRIKTLMKEKT